MTVNLDSLPVELLYRIFQNLSAIDIYFNVGLVNRYFRNIALSYSHFELITDDPESKRLYNELSPSQICSFRLSIYFVHFCSNRLSQFNRIRSLDLTNLSGQEFSQLIDYVLQIMPQLSLTLSQIKDENIEFSDERIKDFIRFVLVLQNLRQILLYHPKAILALESAIPIIEHIYLESMTFTEMCKLKECRPNLRFLTVKQIKFNRSDAEQSMATSPNNIFSNIKHNRPTSVFQFIEIPNSLMKKILFVDLTVALSTLTHLTIQQSAIKDENWDEFFDGSCWGNYLKTSIPHLKSFEFEFIFNYPNLTLTIEQAKMILVPFRTDYWLKEKHWYVNFISSPAYKSRLFTNAFLRDKCEMTDINSLLKFSTDESLLSSQITTHELTIDYSNGNPSPTSLQFEHQIVDLYIRDSIPSTESTIQYLSLNDHIRPYVDYHNVEYFRLGARIAFEDRWQMKTGLLKLFHNIKYLKIDRMEHLYSLFNQRKKLIDLITKQIHLLKIVEPINWWFWRDLPSIKNFCRIFSNVKQLDLNVSHPNIMITIIESLLNLEEAIFRFSNTSEEIRFLNIDLILSKTRLHSLNWNYESFNQIIHLYIDINKIYTEVSNYHRRIVVQTANYYPSLTKGHEDRSTWRRDHNTS